jgi:uncharacterized iron-regulated protein
MWALLRPGLGTALSGLLCAGQVYAGQAFLHMEIGDPARKSREVPVVLDGITDTTTGTVITTAEMVNRLAGTGLLFIGENHANQDFHDVQLRTIKALHEAGREVLVGLEMFPYTDQPVLDNWNAGRYTEDEFVDQGRWYDNWGYHWNYYREIILYARANGIDLYAVNSPRPVVKSVRTKGFQNLTPEEAAHLPPNLAADEVEHQEMYRAFFDKNDVLHMNNDELAGLYRAQTLWDATMGWNALQALQQHGGPKAIMVVLIGAGHVAFGLGAERQIQSHYKGQISSLVPVPVVDDENQPVSQMRASYANFVWGLPREVEPQYPTLGVSLMGSLGKEPGKIIRVGNMSVAQRAGIRVGDILLALDGRPVQSDSTLVRMMAPYRWADQVRLRIRRDGKETELDVPLRRSPPAGSH